MAKLNHNDPNLQSYIQEKSKIINSLIYYLKSYKEMFSGNTQMQQEFQKYIDQLNKAQEKLNEAQKQLIKLQEQAKAQAQSNQSLFSEQVIEKLMQDETFKYSLFIAGAAGLAYYAYAIAKKMHPVYSLLKASGLAIGFIAVVIAVKFAIATAINPIAKPDALSSEYTGCIFFAIAYA
jgi:hypothetical protein